MDVQQHPFFAVLSSYFVDVTVRSRSASSTESIPCTSLLEISPLSYMSHANDCGQDVPMNERASTQKRTSTSLKRFFAFSGSTLPSGASVASVITIKSTIL